jgi:hypothetical protein
MTAAREGRIVKLAPSDLTFLWEECRRCFWLKVKGVLRRPSTPFPKVFTLLDGQTKDHFFGLPTEEMAEGLPPGRVAVGDRSVRSSPLIVPGHDVSVQLGGRIDTALAFDDGSFGVVDFKTSEPKPEHVPFYARQLHAYALAAEHPAEGALRLAPVSRLGLLCVEPVAMVALPDGVAYKGHTHFLEIERDDDAFLAFVSQVLFVLERDVPPDPSPGCGFCRYLATGSLVVLTGSYGG